MLTPELRQDAPPRQDLPYPNGLFRFILRQPLLLHRLGLGFLLPPFRIVILTTLGNQSGLPRRTPVEYRMHGSKIYLVSAWGTKPHWVKNIVAHPHVTVQAGPRTYGAQATLVESPSEALRAIFLFRKPAPAIYDALLARMTDADSVRARELHDLAAQVTVIRLDVTDGGTELPALKPDLAWIWGVVLMLLGGLVFLGQLKRRQRTQENSL